MELLDEAATGAWFAEHYGPAAAHAAFRLELLPAYAVDSDGDDFHRWLAGESEPTWNARTNGSRCSATNEPPGCTPHECG